MTEPSTAVAVVGNVPGAMRSEQTRSQIATLLDTAKAITVITNADGRQQAHSLLMMFVKMRTSIDGLYEAVSAKVRSFLDDTRSERNELKQLFADQESRIRKLRDDWDEDQARIKRELAEAEQRRINGIRARIDDIKAYRDRADGKDAAAIQALIQELVALSIDDSFAEFQADASNTQAFTLDILRGKRDNVVEMENRAAELAEQERKLSLERAAQDLRNAQLAMIRNNFENRVLECARIGTLDVYEDVIGGMEACIIDKADYGDVTDQAIAARSTALGLLRNARTALAQRLEDERQVKEDAARRELAMEAIRAIQDRVYIAAEADSLEAYDLALSLTRGEAVSQERFGVMMDAALTVKTNTLSTLTQRRASLEKRLSDEAEANRVRAEQEAASAAERQRLAADRAELERQQEALRKAQEPAQTVEPEVAPAIPSLASLPERMPAETETQSATEPDMPSVDEAIRTTLNVFDLAYGLDDVRGKELIVRMGDRIRELQSA